MKFGARQERRRLIDAKAMLGESEINKNFDIGLEFTAEDWAAIELRLKRHERAAETQKYGNIAVNLRMLGVQTGHSFELSPNLDRNLLGQLQPLLDRSKWTEVAPLAYRFAMLFPEKRQEVIFKPEAMRRFLQTRSFSSEDNGHAFLTALILFPDRRSDIDFTKVRATAGSAEDYKRFFTYQFTEYADKVCTFKMIDPELFPGLESGPEFWNKGREGIQQYRKELSSGLDVAAQFAKLAASLHFLSLHMEVGLDGNFESKTLKSPVQTRKELPDRSLI